MSSRSAPEVAAKAKKMPPKKDKKTESDFLVKLEFMNKIPDVPYDPKFLKVPQPADRFYKFERKLSMEDNFKRELLADVDVGVNLDFIDLAAYVKAENRGPLNADDKLLTAPFSKTVARQNTGPLTFLRNIEYLAGDDALTAKMKISKPPISQRDWENKEMDQGGDISDWERWFTGSRRQKYIQDVKDSFEFVAKKPLFDYVHPVNKNAKPVRSWSVFPDEQLMGNSYVEVVSSVDPIAITASKEFNQLKGIGVSEAEVRAETEKKRKFSVLTEFDYRGQTLLSFYVRATKKRKLESSQDKKKETEGEEDLDSLFGESQKEKKEEDVDLDALFGENQDEEKKEKEKEEEENGENMEVDENELKLEADEVEFEFQRFYDFSLQAYDEHAMPLVFKFDDDRVTYIDLRARADVKLASLKVPVRSGKAIVKQATELTTAAEAMRQERLKRLDSS